MPRLLVFVPCERLLHDPINGEISIVGLVDNMTIVIPPGGTIPERWEVPFNWIVFSQWMQAEHEQGQMFEQRVELETPSGEIAMDDTAMLFPSGPFHRHAVRIALLPVSVPGVYQLHLSIRETSSGQAWQRQASYPITIKHRQQGELDNADAQG